MRLVLEFADDTLELGDAVAKGGDLVGVLVSVDQMLAGMYIQ